MPLTVLRNDITKLKVDSIVNAANTELRAGGGVCGAIFAAAGIETLQKACDKLAPIKTGDAVITMGYSLPAKYVIHTAGPIYKDGKHEEESLLRSCYVNSLDLAKKHSCESIAFPLLSSGIYGYPKDEALSVATSTVGDWLMKNDMDVYLVVFDKAAFVLSSETLGDVKSFINQTYVDKSDLRFSQKRPSSQVGRDFYADEALSQSTHLPAGEFSQGLPPAGEFARSLPPAFTPAGTPASAMPVDAKRLNIKDKFKVKLDEPFSTILLRLIDSKGKTDVEVYKRANLDRKLFSKIRKGKGYMPSKKTVISLAIALEMSLPETHDLLRRAGFALSRSVVFDVIVEYFITKKHYDIFEINNVLFEYDQPLLGG